MIRYMLTPRNPALNAVAGADEASVQQVVRDLTKRDPLGYPSVRERLRRTGRVYCACDQRVSDPRWGHGIIVERIID